ncbi:MAG TPA: DegT/DnrJ/EryC1/StrS family aminotransferase, partial [Pseudobdellovibrionaceae bacterium]|nr:DegT/DnrJ/EryC1/StrS family aminotransferase [Pseudobdellovibrionaceae bacterium]
FYRLDPYPVIDASLCFDPGTYQTGTFMCLSFQQKKSLPIGRGGMILTSDPAAADWLRAASYDGRTRGRRWKEDPVRMRGYHYYMTPEDAARGLLLLHDGRFPQAEAQGASDYPDLSALEVFGSHGD